MAGNHFPRSCLRSLKVTETFSSSILLADRTALAADVASLCPALEFWTLRTSRSITGRRIAFGMSRRSRKARSPARYRVSFGDSVPPNLPEKAAGEESHLVPLDSLG